MRKNHFWKVFTLSGWIGILALTFANAWAGDLTQHLLTVKVPEHPDTELTVKLNHAGEIDRIVFTTADQQLANLSVADLKRGYDFRTKKGTRAVTIKSTNLDPKNGGILDVEYLYDGLALNPDYRTFAARISRVNGTWYLRSLDPAMSGPFDSLVLQTRHDFWGILIGAKPVKISLGQQAASAISLASRSENLDKRLPDVTRRFSSPEHSSSRLAD